MSNIESRKLTAKELSLLLHQDQLFIQGVSSTCFDRCVVQYGEKAFNNEFLNPLEQNCVDRCTNKAL